jgi:hypothetical protein
MSSVSTSCAAFTRDLVSSYPELAIFLTSHTLLLHVVNHSNYNKYINIINTLQICDKTVFSGNYEQLSYANIEDNPDMWGIFITNAFGQVVLSLIIAEDVVHHHYIPQKSQFQTSMYVEVVLLCTNVFSRVKYAAKHLLTGIIHYYKLYHDRDLVLMLANKQTPNTEAEAFYKKVGFQNLLHTKNILITNVNIQRSISHSTFMPGGKKYKNKVTQNQKYLDTNTFK